MIGVPGSRGDWCSEVQRPESSRRSASSASSAAPSARTASSNTASLIDHFPGPGEALLTGLEHEDDAARELDAGEQARRTREHRGVQVVAAGVHPSFGLGDVRHAGPLGHRQRVHVGAEQDGRSGWRAPSPGCGLLGAGSWVQAVAARVRTCRLTVRAAPVPADPGSCESPPHRGGPRDRVWSAAGPWRRRGYAAQVPPGRRGRRT
jgi:hypothetical protein